VIAAEEVVIAGEEEFVEAKGFVEAERFVEAKGFVEAEGFVEAMQSAAAEAKESDVEKVAIEHLD
jgi:hypothetical protein